MAKRDNVKRDDGSGDPANSSPPAGQTCFQSLTIQDFRCFKERPQTLDLTNYDGNPARWTILLGNNGTGKTSLLQTLCLFYKILTYPNSPKSYIRSAWLARIFLGDLGVTSLSGSTWAVTLASRSLAAGSGPWNPKRHSINFYTPTIIEEDAISHVPDRQDFSRNMTCFAYGAGRRLGTSTLTDDGLSDGIQSLFVEDAGLRNAEEWLLRLDYSAAKRSASQQRQKARLQQVIDLLLNVLPDVEDIRFPASEGPNPQPFVEFLTPYGWVPLRQLGYGYRTLIAWIVDLASRMVERYPDSPDPLAEPAVVLVDEIDLHLHPTWQRKLIGYLTERFPNTQFIVTAHSPLIVQAAEDANIAVLRREGDHVVIDNDVQSIKNWRIDQILTSELFGLESARPPSLDRSLERRREILAKPRMTKKDQRELEKLSEEIGPLPTGDTASQAREMMDLVRETQRLLEEHKGRMP